MTIFEELFADILIVLKNKLRAPLSLRPAGAKTSSITYIYIYICFKSAHAPLEHIKSCLIHLFSQAVPLTLFLKNIITNAHISKYTSKFSSCQGLSSEQKNDLTLVNSY